MANSKILTASLSTNMLVEYKKKLMHSEKTELQGL
jgi:hypothetical protein